MKNVDEILEKIKLENINVPDEIDDKVNYAINNLNINRNFENKYFNSKKLITAFVSLVIIILTTGVYATMKNNRKVEQKEGTIEQNATIFNNSNEYYDWVHDMNSDDNMYYKKITDYSEYLKIKKVWSDVIEMKEEDFENEFFLILIARENTYISNIYCDENTTFIELSYNNAQNYNAEKNRITTKISKELDRKFLDIKVNPNIEGTDSYKKLEDFEKNYSKEEAISEGYFVLDDCEIISKDKEQLDRFIESTNNASSTIRIINYSTYSDFKICDLVYNNGNYQMSEYCPETGITTFATGNRIVKQSVKYKGVFNEKWSYLLVDEEKWNKYGVNETIICAIK